MVTMKDLLECGVHFGHQTRRWNPKMKKFIFGARKNIYIIDLQKTLRYFKYTYNVVRDAAAEGKTVLFVGTKKQARGAIKEYAEKCGMPYVSTRWLGGMLTNYPTMKKSIRKLEIIEQMEENGQINLLTKKEALMLRRTKEKLNSYLEGFRHMKRLPDMMFVVDTVKEHIAVNEAKRLGMKVVAPLDTNCDPDLVDYPIPGNDDAIRSIELFCKEMAEAINEGKAIYAEAHGQEVETAVASEEIEQMMAEEATAEITEGDDLTKIKGIGKVYQEKLNAEGFYTYDDVANMTDEQIQTMEEKYSFKGDFKEAVASAKELAEA
ncbi:MAG TPA: 30S ribosomal protein S2 [Sulfurovum sp. UBA12169]|nr:MAG TPA: 30S ribosomal protein S2 [Sulfurovum sp. UBA12169]